MTTLNVKLKKHMAIVGKTGSGKTALASLLYKNTDNACCIWIGNQLKTGYDHTINKRVDTGKLSKWVRENKKIRYEVNEMGDYEREINNLWNFLKNQNHPTYVFVDEFHTYKHSKNENYFDIFARGGRKYGIHLISIDQRFKGISNDTMNNTEQMIVFLCMYEQRYLRNYSIPMEILDRCSDDFEFVFFNFGEGILPKEGTYKISGQTIKNL